MPANAGSMVMAAKSKDVVNMMSFLERLVDEAAGIGKALRVTPCQRVADGGRGAAEAAGSTL